MTTMKLFVVTIVLAILSSAYGKIFTKCELANVLFNNGFPKSQIPDWICIAEHESAFNTKAINRQNDDGSVDYGIFQINSRYWCSEDSTPGKECNVTCEELLDDDIRDSLACIKIIYNVHHFHAWVAWRNKCDGKPLPSISECFRGDL
uniref:lysozyme n=1 Tax=Anopheles atroparvus TaxID=41427 RepID=A0A182J560_ANOAO